MVLAVVGAAGVVWGLVLVNRSGYVTQEGVMREQPLQFSHKHHAAELGIDCRYCHTQVESAAYAGIPPVATCMNCHSRIWADSPFLEPIRESWRTGRSIEWVKVYDLPDFVYFNHGAHVRKGVGCVSCHGRVDEMNQLWQASSLRMEWCIDCHRYPERHVRPRERVFDLVWTPPVDQVTLGAELVREYDIRPRVDCTTCHR